MSAQEPTDVAHLREAFASLADEGGHAVDSGRIFDALHGDLIVEERHAVVDELLVDPGAAEAWTLAREMAPAPVRPATMAVAAWQWMSLAAAAVLVVALGWQIVQPSRLAQEPAYRSLESKVIASALPAGVPLTRAEPVLRWTGVEGARYRVRLLTPDLEVLEESLELSTSEYRLNTERLRRIPSGGQLAWQVEGRLPNEAIIVSPTFMVRVE